MIRILALVVSALTAVAPAAFAQAHPEPHHTGRPHDSAGHAPMDAEQHAALHALLDGTWLGTLNMPAAESRPFTLNVSKTASGADVFAVTAAPPLHLGDASQFGVEHQRIHWIQNVSGESCKATADIARAAMHDPEILKGTMSCAHGDLTFSLTKTTK
jgi:hypothetical protein